MDHDIAVLESKIKQFCKLGFPFETETAQLETLKSWKEKVQGKVWPEKIESYTSPAPKQTSPLQEVEQINDSALSWPVWKKAKWKKAKKLPASQEWKPMPPAPPAPQKVVVSAGKANLDQEIIMRIGMMSNCNVLIAQVLNPNDFRPVLQLACKVCKKTVEVEDHKFESGGQLSPTLLSFCEMHRHDAATAAVTPSGRMFREDD